MSYDAEYVARVTALYCDRRVLLCACGCQQPAPPKKRWRPQSRFIKGHARGAFKIGLSQSPERRAYQNAKDRCLNPKCECYKNYGGRGIKFLFESFEEFLIHVGRRPSIYHSLERRNNDGPYSPANCCWATMEEQHKNKRHGNQYVPSPALTYDDDSSNQSSDVR
jgi:hypothetical protein